MRLDIIIPIFLSIPIGMAFYFVLTKGITAHLKSLRDKLSFFFWPFTPSRMLVIQELDGEVSIYYDYDFDEVQTENKTLVKTVDGMQYVTDTPPSQAAIPTSMFEARGPQNYYSPFAVAWRWVVAASILIYILYIAVISAVIPPLVTEEVQIGLSTFEVAFRQPIDPWEVLASTVVFFIALMWLIVNIQRMNDKTIMYSWYHAKGINPPHISIVPSPTLSSLGLLDYLDKLGRKIEIHIPADAKDIIEKAMKEVRGKTGSKSLSAVILAKLSMVKTWREAIAEVLSEQFKLMKTGETHAAMRLGIQPLTKRILPILIFAFIAGLVAGYALGNAYSIGVAPPGNQTQPMQPSIPGNQTTPGNQTQVKPPTMPPPPTGVIIDVG